MSNWHTAASCLIMLLCWWCDDVGDVDGDVDDDVVVDDDDSVCACIVSQCIVWFKFCNGPHSWATSLAPQGYRFWQPGPCVVHLCMPLLLPSLLLRACGGTNWWAEFWHLNGKAAPWQQWLGPVVHWQFLNWPFRLRPELTYIIVAKDR